MATATVATKINQAVKLLSIDGGGIQGITALIIIQELMRRIQGELNLPTTPLPWEFFDLIVGTGMGGLIAIMLGRLRMTVEEATDWFCEITSMVFSRRKRWGDGTFKASILETIVGRMVEKHMGSVDAPMIEKNTSAAMCKTVVCAMSAHSIKAGIPTLFRSYESYNNQAPDCTIIQAVRATTAHPGLFKPIEIDWHGIKLPYVDGGLGCNNPTACMLEETKLVFTDQYVGCVVSVGTGQIEAARTSRPGWTQRVLVDHTTEVMRSIAMDCERVAEDMYTRFQNTPGVYFRFNVEQGLQRIRMTDFNRLSEVVAHTRQYNQQIRVNLALGNAAVAAVMGSELVATRHLDGSIAARKRNPQIKICPPPTLHFTGQVHRVNQMAKCILEDPSPRHIFVLHGLGGSGKTQLALKFVQEFRKSFWDVFYIDASSAETINSSFKTLAGAKDAGNDVEQALAWLANQEQRWLLVFNNADDTSLNLGQYFPECSHGDIIITTRNHHMVHFAHPVQAHCKVSEMLFEDAKQLLLKVSHVEYSHAMEESVNMLLKEFDCLALAIVQAAAYICVNACTMEEYLAMYRQNKLILEESRKIILKLGDYNLTVFTTWFVSYRQLGPPAAGIFHVMAFMHHEAISEDIFRCACEALSSDGQTIPPEAREDTGFQETIQFMRDSFRSSDEIWDKAGFLSLTGELRSYSLIDFDHCNRLYSIHPLVQTWISEVIISEDRATAQERLAVLLASCVCREGEVLDDTFLCILLLHTDILPFNLRRSERFAYAFANLHGWASMGSLEEADILWRILVNYRMQELGGNHLSTISARTAWASVLEAQGRRKEAETLMAATLDTRKCVIGESHPDTTPSFTQMARIYRGQGRLEYVLIMEKEALRTYRKVLGNSHLNTIATMRRLVADYHNLGQSEDAIAMQERLMMGILEHIQQLAAVHERERDWPKVEALYAGALQGFERVVGNIHHAILLCMHKLAVAYQHQGKLHQAENLIEPILKRTRDHGQMESEAHRAAGVLAEVYIGLGKWRDAEALKWEVVEHSRLMHGHDHDTTRERLAELASFYAGSHEASHAGRPAFDNDQPSASYQGVVRLMDMHDLVLQRWNRGEYQDARILGEKVLAARKYVLGSNHSDTLTSTYVLALTYQQLGLHEEAQDLVKDAKAEMTKRKRITWQGENVIQTAPTFCAPTYAGIVCRRLIVLCVYTCIICFVTLLSRYV